jgi:hypothetical protein
MRDHLEEKLRDAIINCLFVSSSDKLAEHLGPAISEIENDANLPADLAAKCRAVAALLLTSDVAPNPERGTLAVRLDQLTPHQRWELGAGLVDLHAGLVRMRP